MRLHKSTILRLTLWYTVVLAVFLTLFAAGAYLVFDYGLTLQADRALAEVADLVEETAREEIADAEEDEDEVADEFEAAYREAALDANFKNYRVAVFSAENKFQVQSKAEEETKGISAKTINERKGVFEPEGPTQFYTYSEGERSVRVLYRPLKIEKNSSNLYVIHDLDQQLALLVRIRDAFLLLIPFSLVLSSLGGYFLARKAFLPVKRMTEKAEQISAKNLQDRLPVAIESDELGRLASTFNGLLSRLNRAFDQQRRFMADASHELRTPAAILRGEADVTLKKDKRTEEEYRESLSIIQKEAARMSVIIEDLFTLARADAGENPVTKSDFYLEDVVSRVVRSFRSIALQKGVAIEITDAPEMRLRADEQLVRRLFSNLVDNAVKHARSTVTLILQESAGFFTVDIADDGEGIPGESQPFIFDRFYRVDQARSRKKDGQTGSGAGLGLSISKWIAESHGASLELVRSDENGTLFRIRFPVDGDSNNA